MDIVHKSFQKNGEGVRCGINLLTDEEKEKYKDYISDINNNVEKFEKEGWIFPKSKRGVEAFGKDFSEANRQKLDEEIRKRNGN